ncbi:unnamed protein product [Zymoseptoria tritici ST99CH_3D7]|uniref:Secreted protein n=1 Tax=Zymoseptoria tritici (strain ST99CH_3D7) TaxID=1276538 RepID=A0A1X7RGW7_ZYMT9|nr:unnamed protein product [Zymoseptoria tritici ST99CH_3D7]
MHLLKSTLLLSMLSSVAFASCHCLPSEGDGDPQGRCTGDPRTPDAGTDILCYKTTPCRGSDSHGVGPPCYVYTYPSGAKVGVCPDWPGPREPDHGHPPPAAPRKAGNGRRSPTEEEKWIKWMDMQMMQEH